MYFCNFLKEEDINYVQDLSDELISEYIIYLRTNNSNLRDTSINNYLRSVRAVCYYLMKKNYLDSFKILLIKARKKTKITYSLEEQEKLTKKPNIKECGFSEYRTWVMICHLLATGNRTRTIREIKIGDVNFSSKVIILQEVKNNVPYEIPISKDYYPILKEYIQIRGGTENDYLFCNQYGKQLTGDGFRSIISKYNKSRDVPKSSPHLFRHTFAKVWILNGGSTKKLQKALGINSSSIIDEYLSIYGRELEEDFDNFTPLNQLNNIKIKKN